MQPVHPAHPQHAQHACTSKAQPRRAVRAADSRSLPGCPPPWPAIRQGQASGWACQAHAQHKRSTPAPTERSACAARGPGWPAWPAPWTMDPWSPGAPVAVHPELLGEAALAVGALQRLHGHVLACTAWEASCGFPWRKQGPGCQLPSAALGCGHVSQQACEQQPYSPRLQPMARLLRLAKHASFS